MNKNAIQKFAIWARNELIAQVSQRAYQYGIDESGFGDASADTLNGRLLTAEEKFQRQELIKQIKEKGYQQVMEEVAYTWFNRFIALRFMEVNNYLPSHIRVFSDASGAFKPEILNDVLHLDLPGLDSGKVAEYIESNDTEALYRYLLLTQCNALNSALPVMFERMGGYTEMLLPNNILRQDSVLGHMVSDIPEEDWQDAVQIIGWLYQYYNTELNAVVYDGNMSKSRIPKDLLPAATTIYTPDWAIRYMVENSLGRLWLEGHLNAELHDGWKYYLDEAEQEPDVKAQLVGLREEYKIIKPEEIKVIDPCMGSGHILVYAFDVLMQIYTSAGWDQREAAQSILKNNLFGLDIDDRAAQLAYFAVMMKARQYDRRLLTRRIQPNIFSIRESNGIQAMTIEYFHNNDPKLKADIERIVTEMRDAKEYGSILNITPVDCTGLYARFDEIREDINMMQMSALDELLPLVKCAELLAQKYDVVVTNPPYMAVSNAGAKVNDYVKKNFPDSKADLFAVFIERCGQMAKKNGYQAMITQHAWMFLSSFEKLRTKLLAVDIVNMAHLGARAFEEIGGEVVQTTSFVIRKSHIADYKGKYCRLIEPTSQQGKEDMFLAGENRYAADQSNFSKIPGSPVAYWVAPSVFVLMTDDKLEKFFLSAGRFKSCNDELYLRFWWEPASNLKCWHFYCKGGDGRKYIGNEIRLLNWTAESQNFYRLNGGMANKLYWGKEGITWATITTSTPSFRIKPKQYFWSSSAPTIFTQGEMSLQSCIAYLNSKPVEYILGILNPTASLTVADVLKLPYKIEWNTDIVLSLEETNEHISRDDWDSYETSWDFKQNPLV